MSGALLVLASLQYYPDA